MYGFNKNLEIGVTAGESDVFLQLLAGHGNLQFFGDLGSDEYPFFFHYAVANNAFSLVHVALQANFSHFIFLCKFKSRHSTLQIQ